MAEVKNHQNQAGKAPPAVNWHCEAYCNYGCRFCYARFTDQQQLPRITLDDGIKIILSLQQSGVSKINFVGGEPMLHPHLTAWIKAAKRLGMTTSIVSNGTNITEEWLAEMQPYLDWLGLSVDASTDELHAAMGRGRQGELRRGESHHLARCDSIITLAKKLGYGLKLNTVVSSVNVADDMSTLVRSWMPDRWKIFQALPIAGENDRDIEALEVSDAEFTSYLNKHVAKLSHYPEIEIVGEDNDAMRGTYAMIDPLGLAYTNAQGRYFYSSQPVQDIGFLEAWNQVSHGWSREEFERRDGIWKWDENQQTPSVQNITTMTSRQAQDVKTGGPLC